MNFVYFYTSLNLASFIDTELFALSGHLKFFFLGGKVLNEPICNMNLNAFMFSLLNELSNHIYVSDDGQSYLPCSPC